MLSYVAPRGEREGPDGWNLEDSSYDGLKDNSSDTIMSHGLGQMTDGILGESLDNLTPGNITGWIGWSGRANVELVFQFRDIRQFDNCTMHLAQSTKHGVEVRKKLSDKSLTRTTCNGNLTVSDAILTCTTYFQG